MMNRRRHLSSLAALWLATRALMLWLLTHESAPLLGGGSVAREVWGLYFHWYGVLSHGSFPAHDPLWQYPPGAGAVLLSPALLPGLTYFQAFVVLTLVCDAVIAAALARAGTRPGRSLLGAWLWIGGLPLLLQMPLARYDVQATALAVISLLTLSRFPRVSGGFAALGALVKVWPVLVLLGPPRGRPTRSAWTWAGVIGAVTLGLFALLFNNPLSFLREQGSRGVQIESLGGTALSLARHAGWPGHVKYRYGAMEFVGPYVATVADASLALTAVAFCLMLLWRMRARRWSEATPFDAALCAVLLFTVTSRVISPQYMVWLVGLAAVCLCSRASRMALPGALVVAACLATVLEFPVCFANVVAGDGLGITLLFVRNGLLVLATLTAARTLWRGTVSHPAPTVPPQATRTQETLTPS
jgi:glycosyl transferase family 87